MMGRKKRILIIVLSVILVLALIIGGVIAYLSYATDMFKSNSELFYKYAYQNSSIFNVVDTNLLDRYYQKLNNNKYKDTAEISLETGILTEATPQTNETAQNTTETVQNPVPEQTQPVNTVTENTVVNNVESQMANAITDQNLVADQNGIANTIAGDTNATEETAVPEQIVTPQPDTAQFDTLMNNLKITYEVNSNLLDKKQSAVAKIKYNDQDQFTFNVIKNGDLYGIKSDEVLYQYLTLNNENLRDVYTKLNVENPDGLPNKIYPINYNIYKNMDPNDKQQILARYQNLLNTQIPENHYSKQENVNVVSNGQTITANAYVLELSAQEFLALKIAFLEQLMSDDITLKYITEFIQMDEAYTVNIKEDIQEKINELKRNAVDEEEILKITAYEANRSLVTTTIETGKEIYKIDNDNKTENQKVTITKTTNEETPVTTTTTLERVTSNANNEFKIRVVSQTGETTTNDFALNFKLEGSTEDSLLNLTIELNSNDHNKINNIKFNSSKDFNPEVTVEELTAENSVRINDMTLEDFTSNYNAIRDRLNYLYTTKLAALGFDANAINYQGSLKWSRIVDAFDEDEFKSQVQRALNLAKDDLQNNQEYVAMIAQANGDENQIKQIKGIVTVNRLRETGLDAALNTDDNSIVIKSNNETNRKYEIDYDNFKISKIE